MPTNNPRFTVTIPTDMYDEIERYRFDQKFKSQNSALIALVEEGLRALESETFQSEEKAPAQNERELTVKEQQIVSLLPYVPETIQDAVLAICAETADQTKMAKDFQHDRKYVRGQRALADSDETAEEHNG